MEVTLRGKKYKAENLTDINFFPLGMLFVDSEGRSLVDELTDYESLPQATKLKMLEPLLRKLMNPLELEAIARSISAIFPGIPSELVRYSKDNFNFNLSASELLSISVACGNELQLQSVSGESNESTLSHPGLTSEQLQVKSLRLAEIDTQLSQLESLPSFEGLDVQINKLKQEYSETKTWLDSFAEVAKK